MKKLLFVMVVITIIIGILLINTSTIFASNDIEITTTNTKNNINTSSQRANENNETDSKIYKMKENAQQELNDYIELYGSESYGLTAFILKQVQIYSIPFCFLGVALSAIYQYIIGIRKLDTRDKGFYSLVGFVTIFVICQILPLVFAIVVKGWRG